MPVKDSAVSRFVKIALGLCLIVLFAAAGVYGTRLVSSRSDSSGQGEDARQAVRVAIATPQMRAVENAVSTVGTLRPIRSVALVPDAEGRVTAVPVTSGQEVSAGDVLVQLDDRAAQAAVAEAEATLRETRQDYRRFQQLEDSNAAAEAQLQQARAAFLRAKAARMSAQAALEDRTLTAPFAGKLGIIDTEPGTFLDASQTVTRLFDLSSIEVVASLPESYYEMVQPEQTLSVTTPAYPDESFEGRVTVRASEIDLGSRSFEIRAEIDNPDRRLVGGMFANSRLLLETYRGLAIPDDAIISEGLSTYVYTVTNGTAARTTIEPGTSLGALTEVRNGLSVDDRVVVAGWDRLSDGAPVEIDEDFSQKGLE